MRQQLREGRPTFDWVWRKRRCAVCSLEETLTISRWGTRQFVFQSDLARTRRVERRWIQRNIPLALQRSGMTVEGLADLFRTSLRSARKWAAGFGRGPHSIGDAERWCTATLGTSPNYDPERIGASVDRHNHRWEPVVEEAQGFKCYAATGPQRDHGDDWNHVWRPEDDLRDPDDERDGSR